MRNFEANRWLTVGEAMREIEKLEETGYHTIDLGDAGYHDVECDGITGMVRLQTALLEVSRERAE